MARKLAALAALVGGWLVGIALYRRTAAGRRDRVDLYFDDGSIQSLGDGTPEAARLLPLARAALGAARGG
jgi:hypothetical protein